MSFGWKCLKSAILVRSLLKDRISFVDAHGATRKKKRNVEEPFEHTLFNHDFPRAKWFLSPLDLLSNNISKVESSTGCQLALIPIDLSLLARTKVWNHGFWFEGRDANGLVLGRNHIGPRTQTTSCKGGSGFVSKSIFMVSNPVPLRGSNSIHFFFFF